MVVIFKPIGSSYVNMKLGQKSTETNCPLIYVGDANIELMYIDIKPNRSVIRIAE